jgi:hypothetical protein
MNNEPDKRRVVVSSHGSNITQKRAPAETDHAAKKSPDESGAEYPWEGINLKLVY